MRSVFNNHRYLKLYLALRLFCMILAEFYFKLLNSCINTRKFVYLFFLLYYNYSSKKKKNLIKLKKMNNNIFQFYN